MTSFLLHFNRTHFYLNLGLHFSVHVNKPFPQDFVDSTLIFYKWMDKADMNNSVCLCVCVSSAFAVAGFVMEQFSKELL